MNRINDNDYWRRLADRYFDAAATDDEEAELRGYLAAGLDGGELDDVRAVMGFAAVGGRKCRRAAARRRRRLAAMSAAAVAAVAVVVAFGLSRRGAPEAEDGSVCVAYIGGEEFTDEAVVLAHVRRTMSDMGEAAAEMSVEAQMAEMLNPPGE